ncbi:hypothetical protein AJ79_02453 [Helicocarpus griseus UAMH5409]|uniref:Uncharacterized protein n=1 Tax=Helicocarpus griseus UAMH5409 TaxID=1447875 RepID=A0A2B7Y1Y3_9EURO|nr:hypothetical protein AJ79_02453 [Helicocarpus griseus UAMH5409]
MAPFMKGALAPLLLIPLSIGYPILQELQPRDAGMTRKTHGYSVVGRNQAGHVFAISHAKYEPSAPTPDIAKKVGSLIQKKREEIAEGYVAETNLQLFRRQWGDFGEDGEWDGGDDDGDEGEDEQGGKGGEDEGENEGGGNWDNGGEDDGDDDGDGGDGEDEDGGNWGDEGEDEGSWDDG